MRTRSRRVYVIATLVIAGIVAGAAIADAIRQHSWAPILSVGWLPAVLVATLPPRSAQRDCLARLRRRRVSR
jgi:hypothetical protein